MLRTLAIATMLAAVGLASTASAQSAPPHVKHLFIIVLENEDADTTFAADSPAPYLSQTLVSQGAFLPNYYGTGHESLDNYLTMISGQAPLPQTSADCPSFDDVVPGAMGPDGQAIGNGCVYPPAFKTVADELQTKGISWKGYMEDMGNAPGSSKTCNHPASGGSPDAETATNTYAPRHDPFMYFHSIIDNQASCDAHVVRLENLTTDLASASTTPSYAFITPGVCHDGHDAPCKDGEPGGLVSADTFLRGLVPKIIASPGFNDDGALIITFDEADFSDASSCCGEVAGPSDPLPGIIGGGGGRIGAVVLSPLTKPGTVTQTAYNHYSLLRFTEDNFGVGRLGYSAADGLSEFGTDVFNRTPPAVSSTCASRRTVTYHFHGRLLHVSAGKAKVTRSAGAVHIRLTGLPKRAVHVTITVRRHGRTRKIRHTLHPCTAGH